ncbi:MAG: OmpA family protein [Bacteroidota bacterium]
MKKIFSLIVVSFTMVITIETFAQDSLATARELYNMGMELFDYQTRKQAKEMFVQATEHDPNFAEAHLMAGKAILLTVHKEDALPYLLKAYELNHLVDDEILSLIGEAYQYREEFDNAILYYEAYRKQLIQSLSFDRSRKIYDVEWEIFECRNAKIYIANPMDVEISNLSDNVNSEYPDYGPLVTADEKILIFTSRRPHENNADLAEDFEYYEDIYESDFVNGQWQEAAPMPAPINGSYHNSNIGISPDGSILFIYTDENGGDILVSELVEKEWTKPKPIKGLVNTPYLENSATLSNDHKTLYFVSDKPGGYGGTDIYVSHLEENGRWGAPKNLGNHVNTERDEEGPFISKSGEHLYFSSNGHAGMGDLDIYIAEKGDNGDKESFNEPYNLGYPINSVENDIFFVLSGDESHAYYSSVKSSSKGEQDIYRVDMTKWEPINIDSLKTVLKVEIEPVDKVEPPVDDMNKVVESPVDNLNKVEEPSVPEDDYKDITLLLTVLDEQTLDTLEATIAMINQDKQTVVGGSKNENGTYQVNFTNKDLTNYKVRIQKEGYLPYESMIHVIGKRVTTHVIHETVALHPIKESFTSVINVYFGHDSDQPNSFQDVEYLEVLMKQNPNIKVEISGHTDNTGPAEYNKNLSQRRANAIKDYLVKHNIDPARIEAIGYGMDKPIADNNTRVGRRLNRRTEFKILQF